MTIRIMNSGQFYPNQRDGSISRALGDLRVTALKLPSNPGPGYQLGDLEFEDRVSYDLAYIRNPDLYDVRDWGKVFAHAVEFTCETGVVATLVGREER